MYNSNLQGKYNYSENEVEIESEDLFTAGWCPDYDTKVMSALETVASYDPRPIGQSRVEEKKWYNSKTKEWVNMESYQFSAFKEEPPDELPAFMAVKWEAGTLGVDLRPHLLDPASKLHLLVDSGSQVSAWPPDPGDVPVQGMNLKAVNGSKIQCYGHKEVEIKIGRKAYKFRVIKADVASPVIGWDFVRHYRLDMVWNEWGDIMIRDKKAQVSAVKFSEKKVLQLLQMLWDIETKLKNPKLFFQSNVNWGFQNLTSIWKWPKFSEKKVL